MFLIVPTLKASDDVESYCFLKNESAVLIAKQIEFLKAGNDHIEVRGLENCVDISSTTIRLKLYDKFIYKNYRPIKSTNAVSNGDDENCKIEFTKIVVSDLNSKTIKIGKDSKIQDANANNSGNTVSKFLVSKGNSAQLDLEGNVLNFECSTNDNSNYTIRFYSNDKSNSLSSTVNIKSGDVVDVGEINKTINGTNNSVGLPMEASEVNGKTKIKYELKVL